MEPSTSQSVHQSLEVLRNQQTQHESLKGFGQVQIKAKGRTENFDAALLVQYPNKLLITVLDDLGQERFRLVANGEQVLWYEVGANDFSLVAQEEKSLQRALKLPLSVEEFISRLLGIFPEDTPLEYLKAEGNPSPRYEITRRQDRLEIGQEPIRLMRFTAFRSDKRKKLRYEITYDDFIKVSGVIFPKSIRLSFFKPKTEVLLYFNDLELNPDLSPAKFDTTPPGLNL